MITSISSIATGTVTIDISGAPVLRFTNTFIMKPNLFTGCILTSNHSYFLLVVVLYSMILAFHKHTIPALLLAPPISPTLLLALPTSLPYIHP